MKVILAEQGGKGGSGGSSSIIPTGVNLTSYKSDYYYGDTFSFADLQGTVNYGTNDSSVVLSTVDIQTVLSNFTTNYQGDKLTTHGTYSIDLLYVDSGTTITTPIDVTVLPVVSSIAVTTKPTNENQIYGEAVDTSGMVVTATYSDGTTKTVTDWSIKSPDKWEAVGTQSFTVSYTETGSKEQTADCQVEVQKASYEIELSNTAVSITGSNYSTGEQVTVTLPDDNQNAAVSAVSSDSTACPVSVSGQVITIKGNGVTAGTYYVTVSVSSTTNYTAPEDVVITVTIAYWEWGTEPTDSSGSIDGIGDSDWWSGLQSWIKEGSTPEEREACVGKTKRVSLNSAVAGWNNAIMICIGADRDGDETLTFQTKYCSPTAAAFSSSSALWASSTAKTTCESFASNCSASDSILSVTKQTSSACNNSKTNSPDVETTGKGWLPSECEMGLAGNYASSQTEGTVGVNYTDGYAYPYYSSATARTKHYSDANGNDSGSTGWYWERSRYYNTGNSGGVCAVNTSGSADGYTYSYTGGRLAPAFVIG